jgi:DUF2934 family protein
MLPAGNRLRMWLDGRANLAFVRCRGNSMNDIPDQDIRRRAYQLWQAAGEPEGQADQFWYQAEREILAERQKRGELPPGMTDNLPI